MQPTLISITALARSGAEALAWQLFHTAGFDRIEDDPAVHALHGRLLKDRALGLTGSARRAAAAEAYAAAARLRPATYPLINAATLWRIAGARDTAERLAQETLALLDAGTGAPDTPYYLEATRAEALLLCGARDAAESALRGAIARAPRAWEDHASTLRQFQTILAEGQGDADWLDAYRPPRTLHYAGQMRIADDAAQIARIDALLAAENIGFGFGSLAAGADMLIAERLVARGAELHITLPGDRAAFLQRSVEAFGRDAARFDAILRQATSVRELAEGAADDVLVGEFADEIAMGSAVMRARLLQTHAVQLIISDAPDGVPAAANSARLARIWAATGRRQQVLDAGRMPAGQGGAPHETGDWRLAAVIAMRLSEPGDDGGYERLAQRLAALSAPSGLIAPPGWRSDGVVLYFGSAGEAASEAIRLRAALLSSGPVRIAGDLGVVQFIPAPFGGGGDIALGPAMQRVDRVLDVTLSTAIYVSEHLAAAFAASARIEDCARLELVGELAGPDPPLALYALRAR